jgi:hypothetical protein
MFKHHLTRPDHTDGVGDTLAGDIGCGPVYRLKEGREETGGVDVARRSDADGAGTGRSKIREDVSKEVLHQLSQA